MYYQIKTHYTNLDDTIGDTLNLYTRLNKEIRLYDSGNNDNDEPNDEETQEFIFNSLQDLETFLYYLLAQAAMVLSHSTGDDSYFDYTASFACQYREFLRACQKIDPEQKDLSEYLKDNEYCRGPSFPRALQLNIEFFNNVFLSHQDGDNAWGQDQWYSCNLKPITI